MAGRKMPGSIFFQFRGRFPAPVRRIWTAGVETASGRRIDRTGNISLQQNPLPGDVNADGELNIADVNCITSVILGDPDIYEGRADVNDDGEVTIADINVVIAYILF